MTNVAGLIWRKEPCTNCKACGEHNYCARITVSDPPQNLECKIWITHDFHKGGYRITEDGLSIRKDLFYQKLDQAFTSLALLTQKYSNEQEFEAFTLPMPIENTGKQ